MHIPVFLARGPEEAPDAELRAFYRRLLPAAAQLRGRWRLCPAEGVLAWAWERHLVVVNLSAEPARGRVQAPWTGGVMLTDLLTGRRYVRKELDVSLPPWGAHLFRWDGG